VSELPEEVTAEAKRLTRLARDAVDPDEAAAYERDRDSLLAEHGFEARFRPDDGVLAIYPAEWVEDGVVRPERVDDVDRGVEIPLEGGGGEGWESVEEHNAALVEAVAEAHGPVHAENARSFADFMGNHYLQRVETATARQVREFLDEYFPRNAWPTEAQSAAVVDSLERLFDAADADLPTVERRD